MLKITAAAQTLMGSFFADQPVCPVRIGLLTGGCGIQFLGVAADQAGSAGHDQSFQIAGITYVMERDLLLAFQPITIDSDGFSFLLRGAGIDPPFGCATCAFGCGPHGKVRCTGNCRTCTTLCARGRRLLARRRKNLVCT